MDDGADRVAAEGDLVGGEETIHSVVGHADAAHPAAEDAVGHPGEAVLLLDERGDPLAGGLPEQGGAGVSAHADGDVRAESVDHASGLVQAGGHLVGNLQVVFGILQGELALQAHHRQSDNLIARRGNLFHLHLAFGTDEEDLGLRIHILELVRD